MADTCPTCGGPRQSFYVAGYERAEAKQATRVAELEAALTEIAEATITTWSFGSEVEYLTLDQFKQWQETARVALKGNGAD